MVCILASFKNEIASILERIEGTTDKRINSCRVYEGNFKNSRLRLICTGMGYRAIGDDLLCGCSAVISTGFCGGLAPNLQAGDVVLSREIAYVSRKTLKAILKGSVKDNIFKRVPVLHFPEPSQYARSLKSKLENREQNSVRIYVGRTVTSERILCYSEEKKRMHAYFDAASVDMEDFFRAFFSQRKQMPVVCARAVFDRAEDDVPSIKSAESFSSIPGLLKSYKTAQRSITLLLEYFIGDFMRQE